MTTDQCNLYLTFFINFHNIVFDELVRVKRRSMTIPAISFETRRITTAAYQKVFLDYISTVLRNFRHFSFEQQLIFFSAAENLGPTLESFDNCYDPSLNPQVSLEFNAALRAFHYFIRETFSTYDENFFSITNGLFGRRSTSFPFLDAIDNLSLYRKNKCGITHGLCDASWNTAGVGPSVSSLNLCQLNKINKSKMFRSPVIFSNRINLLAVLTFVRSIINWDMRMEKQATWMS